MGVEIEAQNHSEVMQVRSRELQLENTEKLEYMIPIVESIEEVDLQNVESNTNEIKDMIVNNIDNQVDLDVLADSLEKTNKGITELKKSITRLSNSMKEMSEKLDKLDGDIDG